MPWLRELNWSGIVFGTATGLVASFVLFAFSGPLGTNLVGRVIIQLIGFIAAGYVASRFSLVHRITAGRISSLLLFFLVAVMTIAAGAGANILGLLVLGILAIFGGSIGAALAANRQTR
ncbi:MAG: hypothetical protein DRJ28_03025 [Actinobacteria bacterium]|nr:MAG: hypothetical protein DRJ28_03025 [Actinomycetota bacterium]